MTVSRDKFEELADEVFQKLIPPVEAALEDACMSAEEINEVLLVGGSTRIPWVKSWLEGYFSQPPNESLNPDEGVAYGATIMAGVLAGTMGPDDNAGNEDAGGNPPPE